MTDEQLKVGHACYADDGEYQCNTCLIDFKRMSMEEITERMQKIAAEALKGGEKDKKEEQ